MIVDGEIQNSSALLVPISQVTSDSGRDPKFFNPTIFTPRSCCSDSSSKIFLYLPSSAIPTYSTVGIQSFKMTTNGIAVDEPHKIFDTILVLDFG